MPNESGLIGAGAVNLSPGGKFPFKIFPGGILFFPPGSGEEGKRLFSLVDGHAEGTGYLVLTNLPANPEGAFHNMSMVLDGNTLTVTVSTEAGKAFGHIVNAHFQNLNLTFTEKRQGSQLSVSGGVSMLLFGEEEIALAAGIIEEEVEEDGSLVKRKAFVFQYSEAGGPGLEVEITPVGLLNLKNLRISANHDRWKDLQLLYPFDEGKGKRIQDGSGVEEILDLTIKGPVGSSSWVEGGLSITRDASIQSAPKAASLMEPIWITNEFSIEIWLKPKKAKPGKPSTILALTTTSGGTFFSLNQHPETGGFFVTGLFLAQSPTPSVETHHVVFSREADGTERLFVDGIEQSKRKNAGSLREMSSWNDPKYMFTLANHPGNDQPWEGEVYQLSVYNRALTAENLLNRYYQSIELSGEFRISDAPVPLDKPFPATFSLFKDAATVAIDHEEDLGVRPELHFEKLTLRWEQLAPESWRLTGNVNASFWDNKVVLDAGLSRSRDRPLLVLNAGETTLSFDNWGKLLFTSLELKVNRSGDAVNWSLNTTTSQDYFLLPTPEHRPLDAQIDYTLLAPELTLTPDLMLLKGQWLNETVAFKTISRNSQRLLATLETLQLIIPFSLDLPDFYDPKTGAKIAEAVHIELENMNIQLDLELGANGFLGVVNSAFGWNDQSETRQELTLTPFRLYLPPPTRHALLAKIIEEVKKQADEMFADQGKHAVDYYLAVKDDAALIYLSDSNAMPEKIETQLPALFTSDKQLMSSNGIISLTQSGNTTTLVLNLKGRQQKDFYEAFHGIWNGILAFNDFLLPGAAQLLRRSLAERLPQQYDRLLYYHYNWKPEDNYLDLHPGMRLRVDFQNYQFVRASETNARNGYVGSGSTYFHLNSYAHRDNSGKIRYQLGFDPFLSQIQGAGMPLWEDGAGGIFELFQGPDSRKAHYRLFYPRQFTGLGPERVATILGANDLQSLEEATPIILNNGSVSPNGAISFYFRGKATVIPEMQVFVRDKAVYVPVGTTVRQLIERHACLPAPGLGEDLSAFLGVARPLRLVHNGENSEPAYVFINLEAYQTFGDKSDLLDLPMIMGDRFYF